MHGSSSTSSTGIFLGLLVAFLAINDKFLPSVFAAPIPLTATVTETNPPVNAFLRKSWLQQRNPRSIVQWGFLLFKSHPSHDHCFCLGVAIAIVSQIIDIPPNTGGPGPIISLPNINLGGLSRRDLKARQDAPEAEPTETAAANPAATPAETAAPATGTEAPVVEVAQTGGDDQIPSQQLAVNEVVADAAEPPAPPAEPSVAPAAATGGDDSIASFSADVSA
ncbi:hypothetical protein DFJ77DRAFT_459757 [Powellomyces hirtus]|nr:hypothetical protein DFJ77DRAFT_459757 [Powellomyces hirtus]